MIELYYNSYSVAYFVVSRQMGAKSQMEFLDKLYEQEYEFLHPIYKRDKKGFISEVLYWTDYLLDKETIDKEYPVVEQDFKSSGRHFIKENRISDYPEFDLFFMLLRLRIRYSDGKDYVRMKLRTLLKHYGYKRRNDAIISRFKDCMMFYHIHPQLRDEGECDIRTMDIDDMITFKVL